MRGTKLRQALPWALFLLALAGFIPCVWGQPRPLGEADVDEILRRVKAKEEGLRTLEARFFQERQSPLLKAPLVSEGKLFLDRKGRRLLLRVEKPKPYEVLLEKGRVVTRAPDAMRTDEYYVGGDVLGAYLGLGRTLEELKSRYEIRLREDGAKGVYALRLIPRRGRLLKRIRVIEAEVDSKMWLPTRILYEDVRGGTTRIRLESVRENRPLPEGVFDIRAGGQVEW